MNSLENLIKNKTEYNIKLYFFLREKKEITMVLRTMTISSIVCPYKSNSILLGKD